MTHSSLVQYGNLSKIDKEDNSWGSKGVLFSDWGWEKFILNGYLVDFIKETKYSEWADDTAENLCIVENGEGSIVFREDKHNLSKGFVFKIFPGQTPVIKPDNKLTVLSVQMPNASAENATQAGEDLNLLKVVRVSDVPELVYEYEALGQELITCGYDNGLGIIKLTFPIDKIPLHRHPTSGRLIRTIAGEGYTYVHPDLHKIGEDDFSLFPKNVVHTNGPTPGSMVEFYAYHLPWVPPGIDEEHIAGDEGFVQYEGPPIPKKLWKTKQDFYRAIKKMAD